MKFMDTAWLKNTVRDHIRTDAIVVTETSGADRALQLLRATNPSAQISYCYVVDDTGVLTGVLPVRRLLSADSRHMIKEIMLTDVVTIRDQDTLEAAHRTFSKHKYLSLPVVDEGKRFIGVLDISVLAGNEVDVDGKQQFDDVFEAIGVRSSFLEYLSPLKAFRHRFPWLIPTILTGIGSALLASYFEQTIAEALIIAFFLTLMLGLGESVSIQSLAITIRRLHAEKPTWTWYIRNLGREFLTCIVLGLGVALIVSLVVWIWHESAMETMVIGTSILFAFLGAGFFGITVPTVLHRMKLDPRVSAGPLVLGLTDFLTLLVYFSLARLVLG